jgi:hypothetical protein
MKWLSNLNDLAFSRPPIFPEAGQPDRLCERCKNLDLGASAFHWLDRLADLRESAKSCRFCRMRWDASGHLRSETDVVRFERVGPVVRMNESDPPVFTICRSKSERKRLPLLVLVLHGLANMPKALSTQLAPSRSQSACRCFRKQAVLRTLISFVSGSRTVTWSIMRIDAQASRRNRLSRKTLMLRAAHMIVLTSK